MRNSLIIVFSYTKTNKYSKVGTAFYNAAEKENWEMSSTYANDWQNGHGRYDENIRLNEHFTETVSMVAFKNKTDKRNAKIKDVNGEYVGYDEFINRHPSIVPVIEKILF